MTTKPRVVVCAGNRLGGQIVCGARHFDQTMASQMDFHQRNWGESEQGFIDQYGAFMTREEAWIVAEAAGQIKYRCGGDGIKLYSENLY